MARDYAIVTPQFWTGTTGRDLRDLGCQAQLVALYLVTNPHANMLGLYYLPIPYISHETGIPLEGASKALRSLGDVGFALYDAAEEVVWVPTMATYQIGEALKPADKRVMGVVNELAKYRKSRFYAPFLERYAGPFNLPAMPPASCNAVEVETAAEAPSKPLRSQDQDQDQDHKQEPEKRAPSAAADPPANDVVAWLPCVGNGPKQFPVTEADVASWKEAFPGIDVVAEIRKARAWLRANPTKRKTRRGCPAFLVRWLSKAQDDGRGRGAYPVRAPAAEPPPPLPDPGCPEWGRLRAAVQGRVRPEPFAKFHADLVGRMDGSVLVLVAPDGYRRDFLVDNHRAFLAQVAREIGLAEDVRIEARAEPLVAGGAP